MQNGNFAKYIFHFEINVKLVRQCESKKIAFSTKKLIETQKRRRQRYQRREVASNAKLFKT